jgi:hypothetical protein
LDSLSKEIKSGKYCYDIEQKKIAHAIIGFKAEDKYLSILKEGINKSGLSA